MMAMAINVNTPKTNIFRHSRQIVGFDCLVRFDAFFISDGYSLINRRTAITEHEYCDQDLHISHRYWSQLHTQLHSHQEQPYEVVRVFLGLARPL